MNEPSKNGRSPSDDPSDYSLPREVTLDLPDEAPDSIDDTITVHDYSDRDTDAINYEPFIDYVGNTLEARALAVFTEHSDRGLHPQELAHRAGINYEDIPALLEALKQRNIIRQSRTVDSIPYYQLDQLSSVGLRLKQLAS